MRIYFKNNSVKNVPPVSSASFLLFYFILGVLENLFEGLFELGLSVM